MDFRTIAIMPAGVAALCSTATSALAQAGEASRITRGMT